MLNVLVVDDAMIMRRSIKTILKELGHNVIAEAKSGKEAILLYNKFLPDLVTMDITMPDMDGVTAVKLLKEEHLDINVIMITSHGQEDMVRKSIKNGAKGYVLKPISKEKIKISIDKIFYNSNNCDTEELLDD